eukprot:GEMP01013385.1.p1 GENE.GEMP01013385.1~~GEMP01013385.1.p1  ORF type:complete len:666 (+),score=183.35 GEMP01013385.1:64-2061(+)
MDTKRSRADQRITPRVQEAPRRASGSSSHRWIELGADNPIVVPDDTAQRTRADQRIRPRLQEAYSPRGRSSHQWVAQAADLEPPRVLDESPRSRADQRRMPRLTATHEGSIPTIQQRWRRDASPNIRPHVLDMVMQPGTHGELTAEHWEYVKKMQAEGDSGLPEILPAQDPPGAMVVAGALFAPPEFTPTGTTTKLASIAKLGFLVAVEPPAVTIVAVEPDSWAADAGLLVGDRVTEVNGVSIDDLIQEPDQVYEKMRERPLNIRVASAQLQPRVDQEGISRDALECAEARTYRHPRSHVFDDADKQNRMDMDVDPMPTNIAQSWHSFDQAIQTELWHWDQSAQTESATRTMATMTEDHICATGELQDIDTTVLPLVELAVRDPSAFAKQLNKLHQLQAHEALFVPDKENLAFYGESNVWDMPSEKVKRECVRLEGRAIALARQLESCLMPPILHDPPPPARTQLLRSAPPPHLSLAANVPSGPPLPSAAYLQSATRRHYSPDARHPRQRWYCPGVVPNIVPQSSSAPSAVRLPDDTGSRRDISGGMDGHHDADQLLGGGVADVLRGGSGSTTGGERVLGGSAGGRRLFRGGTEEMSRADNGASRPSAVPRHTIPGRRRHGFRGTPCADEIAVIRASVAIEILDIRRRTARRQARQERRSEKDFA